MIFPSIATVQCNPCVGDIAGNSALVQQAYSKAKAAGAELVIFPELALLGYAPQDLVLLAACQRQIDQAIASLSALTYGGPPMLLGAPYANGGKLYNAVYLIQDGRLGAIQTKHLLPNDGVFDEKRYFSPGPLPAPLRVGKHRIGLMICEDAWHADVAASLAAAGCDWFCVVNASPYESGKPARRLHFMQEHSKTHQHPLLYVNLVGGQDHLVFDGHSFLLDAKGECIWRAPGFVSDIFMLPAKASARWESDIAMDYRELCLGLHDYVKKNGFKRVLLGVSGGIDSALVATLAVDALGAKNVHGVMLPSCYTSDISLEDAHQLTSTLGMSLDHLPIQTLVDAAMAILPSSPKDLTQQNLQARARGLLLMALANDTDALLLTTGNKSEYAMGYATLYGDMCGAFAPLGDVYKTYVYALANWRNQQNQVIPARILDKAPTAELKEDQKDSDTLPPYPLLDAVLTQLIEEGRWLETVSVEGADANLVANIARMLYAAEFKRQQAAPCIKLTRKSFRYDRRYPITNHFA
jgi:NAD+ synthase